MIEIRPGTFANAGKARTASEDLQEKAAHTDDWKRQVARMLHSVQEREG